MGRLIIDGNSCFEIDEQCLKKKKIPKSCGLEKYISDKAVPQKTIKHNPSGKEKFQ